jgi:hypothetical protein
VSTCSPTIVLIALVCRRLLGARPVELTKIRADDATAVLALSSRPWLLYSHQNRLQLSPLSYIPLDHAASFSSEACREGIVAVAGNTLRYACRHATSIVKYELD